MTKKCDACDFLRNPNPTTQILETEYWNVGVGNNHAYFGRAYATLKSHTGSLAAMSEQEWTDFQTLVATVEKSYKEVFGAEPLNWGCYMNHAFREKPYNPHVHWHIYPRYSKSPEVDGVIYEDPNFGSMYDSNAERIVGDEVVAQIAEKLRQNIQHSDG